MIFTGEKYGEAARSPERAGPLLRHAWSERKDTEEDGQKRSIILSESKKRVIEEQMKKERAPQNC